MKVLILDNYDSFTYNLYQYVGEILLARNEPFTIEVKRNDEITLAEIKKQNYDRIIISPGPGDPRDSAYFGVCASVIRELGKTIPVLGICLGMQGMAAVFGGKIVSALVPMHGKTSPIRHDGKGVFAGISQDIEVMRYHSLIVEEASLSDEFVITARTRPHPAPLPEGEGEVIMGIRHKKYPIEGIQFHPESFATEAGKRILKNFLERK